LQIRDNERPLSILQNLEEILRSPLDSIERHVRAYFQSKSSDEVVTKKHVVGLVRILHELLTPPHVICSRPIPCVGHAFDAGMPPIPAMMYKISFQHTSTFDANHAVAQHGEIPSSKVRALHCSSKALLIYWRFTLACFFRWYKSLPLGRITAVRSCALDVRTTRWSLLLRANTLFVQLLLHSTGCLPRSVCYPSILWWSSY
jgi:hypothetical protein